MVGILFEAQWSFVQALKFSDISGLFPGVGFRSSETLFLWHCHRNSTFREVSQCRSLARFDGPPPGLWCQTTSNVSEFAPGRVCCSSRARSRSASRSWRPGSLGAPNSRASPRGGGAGGLGGKSAGAADEGDGKRPQDSFGVVVRHRKLFHFLAPDPRQRPSLRLRTSWTFRRSWGRFRGVAVGAV